MLLGVFDIYILSPMSLCRWLGVYVEPSKIIAHGNTTYYAEVGRRHVVAFEDFLPYVIFI